MAWLAEVMASAEARWPTALSNAAQGVTLSSQTMGMMSEPA